MHSLQVFDEQILSVKFRFVRALITVTFPSSQLEMLSRNVPLPFISSTKVFTARLEEAVVGFGVLRLSVFPNGGFVSKRK